MKYSVDIIVEWCAPSPRKPHVSCARYWLSYWLRLECSVYWKLPPLIMCPAIPQTKSSVDAGPAVACPDGCCSCMQGCSYSSSDQTVRGSCGMDSAGDNCCSESALWRVCCVCMNAHTRLAWFLYVRCIVCVVVDACSHRVGCLCCVWISFPSLPKQPHLTDNSI